jgi:predicted MFS family arabinose efflux permease
MLAPQRVRRAVAATERSVRIPSPGAAFGLGGLPAATQRGLAVTFATSLAVILGVQLIYPVLPALMQQFRVEPAAVGLVITVYAAPAIFLAPVTGAIADLHGRRPLLVVGLLVFGLGGAGVALAPSFEWVLVLRAVQGIGASAIMPLTIVLLGDLLDGDRETSAQGAKVFLDRVALMLVPAVAGALVAVSWNAPFLVFAVAIPVALLGLSWLPPWQRPANASLRSYAGSFGGIRQRPRLLIAFGAGFLRFFLDYAYFTYLPIFLALTHGTSAVTIGLLFACFAVGAMTTSSQAGRIARGRDPAALVFVGFALAGVSVLLVPLLPNAIFQGAAMLVYGLGNGLISPLQKSLLTRNAPADLRAGVISLDRVFQQIAKTLAPTVMGLVLLAADVSVIFWLLGALSLGSVALAATLLNVGGRAEAKLPA